MQDKSTTGCWSAVAAVKPGTNERGLGRLVAAKSSETLPKPPLPLNTNNVACKEDAQVCPGSYQ